MSETANFWRGTGQESSFIASDSLFCLQTIFAKDFFMGSAGPDVELLKREWKLTEDEDDGVTFPGGLWSASSDSQRLCLVGHLLSSRPYHFEALSASIHSMLLPIKGLDIRELPEKRLLLRFKHPIDKRRALDGCPWSFEKNILLLADLKEDENPMKVELKWRDFFVHVHDIPLNMMNRGVATLLGNRIEIYRDMEMDAEGCSLGLR
ncbi:UNVERIFIED_CONTAM: hypothetical protein Slati_0231600 [Sesamum latifolium]|uniref:DUF4283 domain-containing protein n=1 Tax=Sesamum latifolium TaxID=2727402 RepID=A0AAW2YD47_9LAMI